MKRIFYFIFFSLTMATKTFSQTGEKLAVPNSVTIAGELTRSEAKQLMQTAQYFYAFWNTGKEEFAHAAVAKKFIDNTLPKGRPQGFEGLIFASKNFRAAVPDLKCTIEDLIITKEKVTARLKFEGHNTGPLNGHKPSGKAVAFFAIDILHIKDGKIIEDWHLEDNLTFLQQIGIVN